MSTAWVGSVTLQLILFGGACMLTGWFFGFLYGSR